MSGASVEAANTLRGKKLDNQTPNVPAALPTKLFWQVGDSLTYGFRPNDTQGIGGYRSQLVVKAVAGGYRVLAEGTVLSPSAPHDGHAGFTIAQIDTVVRSTYTTLLLSVPQIVIYWAGANDMGAGYNGAALIATMQSTLQYMQGIASTVPIVVTTVTAQKVNGANIIDFNSRLPAMWNAVDAARPPGAPLLTRVDLYTAVGPYAPPNFDPLASDTVHLTDDGYSVVSNTFEAGMIASGIVP